MKKLIESFNKLTLKNKILVGVSLLLGALIVTFIVSMPGSKYFVNECNFKQAKTVAEFYGMLWSSLSTVFLLAAMSAIAFACLSALTLLPDASLKVKASAESMIASRTKKQKVFVDGSTLKDLPSVKTNLIKHCLGLFLKYVVFHKMAHVISIATVGMCSWVYLTIWSNTVMCVSDPLERMFVTVTSAFLVSVPTTILIFISRISDFSRLSAIVERTLLSGLSIQTRLDDFNEPVIRYADNTNVAFKIITKDQSSFDPDIREQFKENLFAQDFFVKNCIDQSFIKFVSGGIYSDNRVVLEMSLQDHQSTCNVNLKLRIVAKHFNLNATYFSTCLVDGKRSLDYISDDKFFKMNKMAAISDVIRVAAVKSAEYMSSALVDPRFVDSDVQKLVKCATDEKAASELHIDLDSDTHVDAEEHTESHVDQEPDQSENKADA